MSQEDNKVLVDRLLKVEAALTVARNTVANVYRCLSAIEFRHEKVDCGCVVCQDVRRAQEGMKTLTGAVIERLEQVDQR